MAEDQGKEEEKFDFTGEGEAVGYISLDDARVMARIQAREGEERYKEHLGCDEVVWTEHLSEKLGEDYYKVVLQFCRPGRNVSEEQTGEEEFLFDLTGTLLDRQILVWPEEQTPNNEPVRDTSPAQSDPHIEATQHLSSQLEGNPIPNVTQTATRDTAHTDDNASIVGTSQLRTIAIKIPLMIVGLWSGFLWIATIAVIATNTTALVGWFYLVGAIASTVAVVLINKMNKLNANAFGAEVKFWGGPTTRPILLGVLIIVSVTSFVMGMATTPEWP